MFSCMFVIMNSRLHITVKLYILIEKTNIDSKDEYI